MENTISTFFWRVAKEYFSFIGAQNYNCVKKYTSISVISNDSQSHLQTNSAAILLVWVLICNVVESSEENC